MAGIWNKSHSQVHDQNGRPLIGARAYFFLGGTTTPITVYGDFSLGDVNALTNPVVSDGNGYFPSVFFDEADEFFRERLSTAGGVQLYDFDMIPIIGPAGGGGGGSDNPINPNAAMQTGDMMMRYDTTLRDGFVRLNGRTIGSATSGAAERANADVQALFTYLWAKNTSLVVVGGRGANAAADWAANKQLTLPDWRGRVPVGLDTMGNIAANVVPGATSLNYKAGAQTVTLTVSQMPAHSHTGETLGAGAHDHEQQASVEGSGHGRQIQTVNGGGPLIDFPTSSVPPHSHGLSIDDTGGGAAHNNLQPSAGITYYIRL